MSNIINKFRSREVLELSCGIKSQSDNDLDTLCIIDYYTKRELERGLRRNKIVRQFASEGISLERNNRDT